MLSHINNDTTVIFRVDIGFSPSYGYAAVITRAHDNKQKGIKGNSIRQLMRRVHEQIAQADHKRRMFPLEAEPARIIRPSEIGTGDL